MKLRRREATVAKQKTAPRAREVAQPLNHTRIGEMPAGGGDHDAFGDDGREQWRDVRRNLEQSTLASVIDAAIYEVRKATHFDTASCVVVLEQMKVELDLELPEAKEVHSTQSIYEILEDKLGSDSRLTQSQRVALREPLEVAKNYLAVSDTPLWKPVALQALRTTPPADATRVSGYPANVASIRIDELAWPDVKEYVETRLGPVAELLDSLTDQDRLVFTNLGAGAGLPADPPVTRVEQLNLPVSSWAKALHLATHADGTRTLVMSEFPGNVLMRHFQLLARHRLESKGTAPQVSTVESPGKYQGTYDSLKDFFRSRKALLGRIDAVVVGYQNAFEASWKGHFQGTVKGDDDSWSADVYRLPNGKRVAVLATPDSLHGEILGQSLRTLVNDDRNIQNVFVAGSAGSLHFREPYAMIFPNRLVGDEGASVQNVLTNGSDDLVHRSVLSPLEETPSYIQKSQANHVTTVDMEMGHVATALKGTHVEVGCAMLVTDFPAGWPLTKDLSLTFQDSARKATQIARYPEAIAKRLTEGVPVATHPLEEHMGKTISELSRENIARRMADIGELTPEEKVVFDRVRALEPNYSFRVSLARLSRLVEDGVILSTAQVAEIKKAPVSPYTPQLEQQMYGAYDYTFGAISFNDGDKRYGDVVLRLRPEVVQARSWASRKSGFGANRELRSSDATAALRRTAEAGPTSLVDFAKSAVEGLRKGEVKRTSESDYLTRARDLFASWVVEPEHYQDMIATQILWRFRDGTPEFRERLLGAEGDELARFLGESFIGYLEGKIKGSLNLVDLESVSLPSNAPPDVVARLVALGIETEVRPTA